MLVNTLVNIACEYRPNKKTRSQVLGPASGYVLQLRLRELPRKTPACLPIAATICEATRSEARQVRLIMRDMLANARFTVKDFRVLV